jgi:hypothetical protein
VLVFLLSCRAAPILSLEFLGICQEADDLINTASNQYFQLQISQLWISPLVIRAQDAHSIRPDKQTAFSQSSFTSNVSESAEQFCAALKYEKQSMHLLNNAASVIALAATPIASAILTVEHRAYDKKRKLDILSDFGYVA